MILLDTFTFIGVTSEPARLSPAARLQVEDAETRLFVSAITMFELPTAVAKGRLTLDVDPRTYFALALTRHKIGVLDLTWEIAALSCELPPKPQRSGRPLHHCDGDHSRFDAADARSPHPSIQRRPRCLVAVERRPMTPRETGRADDV